MASQLTISCNSKIKGVWFALNEISDIHWHLFNGGVVERLNVFHDPFFFIVHQTDGHPFPTKSAASTNPGKIKR